MREHDDPEAAAGGSSEGLVPPGHVLIGANYNAKTGDLNHTILMNDDVDPAILREILDSLERLTVKRRRFRKLRLPPQKNRGQMRAFKGRILLRPGHAVSSFGPGLTKRIAQVVILSLFRQMGEAVGEAAEAKQ